MAANNCVGWQCRAVWFGGKVLSSHSEAVAQLGNIYKQAQIPEIIDKGITLEFCSIKASVMCKATECTNLA